MPTDRPILVDSTPPPVAHPKPSSRLRRHWPLWAVLGIFCVTVGFFLLVSVKRDSAGQLHLIYALDDPYIHMAIAKHFALDGTWGVSRFEPSSSSSSLLWTLLLSAIYKVIGPNEIVPFILNFVCAVGLIGAAYMLLLAYRKPAWLTFVVLCVLVIAAPLPILLFIGMEHTLQSLVVLVFVSLSARLLCDSTVRLTQPLTLAWFALAPLMTLVRYEGLFVVGVVVVLCLFRRRVLSALFLTSGAALPVTLYALI